MAWQPRRIVVPFDFSDESIAALNTALDIGGTEADVHLLHVLPDLSVADPGVVWQGVSDQSRIESTQKALRKALEDKRYEAVARTVLIGDAGHEIADFASEQAAELIVLSSHGRRGVQRLLIGSVAERVLRLAHCPVLVLRK